MAKTATIKIKVEPALKKEVDSIFKSLGISTAEAIQLNILPGTFYYIGLVPVL